MSFPPGDPYGGPPGGWTGGYPGQPPHGYAFDHPQGTTVLILGILSIVLCQICGPFAWVMGRRAMAEIDSQPGRYSNRGAVQAGYICGIVGSILLGVYLVLGLLYAVVVVVAVGSSS